MNLYWIAGVVFVLLVVWFVALPWIRNYKANRSASKKV